MLGYGIDVNRYRGNERDEEMLHLFASSIVKPGVSFVVELRSISSGSFSMVFDAENVCFHYPTCKIRIPE
jgi:hypothetical protein